MHLQIRVRPKLSPPDVEKLLRHLAAEDVNLKGVGGSNVEFGGEFAFAVADGDEDKAKGALDKYGYQYRSFEYQVDPELTLCWLEDRVGMLHECIEEIAAKNLESGRIIRDILIGVPTSEGVPVQVFSDLVRTTQSLDAVPR